MALVQPEHIRNAGIADPTIRFAWDDWNVEQAEEPIDDEFLARLISISRRGNIAYTNATAEWLLARFEGLADIVAPNQYLESAWACVVDIRYCGLVWEDFTSSTDWTGPVRGPIGIAMTRVQYAIGALVEGGDPELRAAWLHNICRYVMPKPDPFLTWSEVVLTRMQALYPRSVEDPVGEVVPREALNLAPFAPENTEELINRFLATLRPDQNRFLSPPQKLLDEGFIGQPYQFDIELERRTRTKR